MNKLIFQFGLLAFLIALVVFGTEHYSLIDTVSRAFIVFIGVVLASASVLTVGVFIATKGKDAEPAGEQTSAKPGQPTA